MINEHQRGTSTVRTGASNLQSSLKLTEGEVKECGHI